MTKPPALIALNHDDDHAEFVGHTTDGRQFFLTTPFDPEWKGHPGNEFVALFVFDKTGRLLEALIDEFGPRKTMDKQKRRDLRDRRLKELGKIQFGRIVMAPFEVERFGLKFGLILRKPDAENPDWTAEMHPGNYMAFFDPWDSGDYDT